MGTRVALAECLVRLGLFQEADVVMHRATGRLAAAVSQGHFERRLYLNTLVAVHEGLGQPEKAAEYRALLREADGADEAGE